MCSWPCASYAWQRQPVKCFHITMLETDADFRPCFDYTTTLTKFDWRDFTNCSMSSFVVPLAENTESNRPCSLSNWGITGRHVCMRMHTHTHTHTYACTLTHTHAYTQTWTHTYVPKHAHTHTHTHTLSSTQTFKLDDYRALVLNRNLSPSSCHHLQWDSSLVFHA